MKKKLILLALLIFINTNNIYALENYNTKSITQNINNKIEYEIYKDEPTNFDITSKNVILYNLNDSKILYEKNSDKEVQIASLTKIMTVLVAIENIENIKEEITITKEIFSGIEEYSQAGLKVGDKVTYEDLLYGAMLPSGADAVNALVLNICPNQDEFIKLMNNKAKSLKMANTKFDNAIGMDSKNNYSTASDLSKLLINALKNETFKKIYTTTRYTINSLNIDLKSTLLSYGKNLDITNITGSKSGFTDGAGVCLSSTATINDVNYLLIVLGANTSSKANAIKDSLEIYKYYGKNYSYKEIIKQGQVLETIKIKYGKKKNYDIKSPKQVKLYLKNTINTQDITYTYKGIKELTYKNKPKDELGIITVKYQNKVLTSFKVYLNDDLEYYHPIIYSVMLLAIILMIISITMMKKSKKKKNKSKSRKNHKKKNNN